MNVRTREPNCQLIINTAPNADVDRRAGFGFSTAVDAVSDFEDIDEIERKVEIEVSRKELLGQVLFHFEFKSFRFVLSPLVRFVLFYFIQISRKHSVVTWTRGLAFKRQNTRQHYLIRHFKPSETQALVQHCIQVYINVKVNVCGYSCYCREIEKRGERKRR